MTADDYWEQQLAELRREIRALKAQRVGYVQATVTAVDVAASTFSALVPSQVDDAQTELAGIASPPHFLPNVGDTVLLALSGATPIYQPGQVTANSITPDGVPYQVTDLGKTSGGTDDTGNTVWQIDQDGGASFTSLSSDNDPIFQGTPLSELLAPLASFYAGASRGADNDPALTPAGGGETGFYEMTVEFQPGHIYKIETSNVWVRPLAGCTRADLNLHCTVSTDPAVDPPAVSLGSEIFARCPSAMDASNGIGHPLVISRLYRVTQYAHFRFLLALGSTGGQAYIELGSADYTEPTLLTPMEPDSVQLFVTDLGENPWTNRAVLNSGGGGGTTPAPVKRYTFDYFSHWSRWFRGDGSVAGDNGDCYQGQTPYYPANGDEATQIGQFTRPSGGPSLHTDLAGATVEGLWVYLYANHWHYNSGGTAVIRYHNNSAAGSLNNFAGGITVPGWARGQGRWVNILSWASLFQGTAAQGIQVGKAGSTDPIFYGVFDGPGTPNAPRIRATFTR